MSKTNTTIEEELFDTEDLGELDEQDTEIENEDEEDEMLDIVIGATVTDGEYEATLVNIEPKNTKYLTTQTSIISGVKTTETIEKKGKVYNFIWKLTDGRRLIDPRFTRDSEDHDKKYQSINIALGNIATQLKQPTLTMRELLDKKPTIKVWVSRFGKNRNVDYLQPIAKAKPVDMTNLPPL